MSSPAQLTLSTDQLEAFYHDEFVEDQARHFMSLAEPHLTEGTVLCDVGGGCGHFAKRLMQLMPARVRVVELDPASVQACHNAGVDAVLGDAIRPPLRGDEGMASFNLILHHLVGCSEQETRKLQSAALLAWRGVVPAVFVNEYVYQSYISGFSGWLIFQITKSRLLSTIGRAIATFVPSLRANTFGVGVRFRSHEEWRKLFEASGYEVIGTVFGVPEGVSLPRRALLISAIRRDSFLLAPCRDAA